MRMGFVVWLVLFVASCSKAQQCLRSSLTPLIITECKTSSGVISHDRYVTNGTTCFVRCSERSWAGHGLRKCVNGNWEGKSTDCKGTPNIQRIPLDRSKRGNRCHGWWNGKKCAWVEDGGSLDCSSWGQWKKCRAKYSTLVINCRRPSSSDIYTYKNYKTAKVSWSFPTSYGGGGHRSIWQIAGKGTGSSFEIGKHNIGYKVQDKTGRSATCRFSFHVLARICPVYTPKNGSTLLTKIPVVWSDTYLVKCNLGYTINGHSNLTCQENQTVDYKPTCDAVPCDKLQTSVDHGRYICKENSSYGDVCELECGEGFIQDGKGKVLCGPKGTWIVPDIFCKDIQQPIFTKCPNNQTLLKYAERSMDKVVAFWDINAMDNSGEVIITQNEGPKNRTWVGAGKYDLEFLATDGSGLNITCNFNFVVEVLRCPHPPNMGDKNLLYNCNFYLYGGKCDLSCRHNRPLLGDSVITCEKSTALIPSTYWNYYSTPHCHDLQCPILTPPLHGALTCDGWVGGTFCTMMCNSKYDVPRGIANGQNNFICSNTDLKWKPTDNVPDCTVKRESSAITSPAELYLYFDGNCEDVKAEIREKFMKLLHDTSQGFSPFCDPYDDCKAENVKVSCGGASDKRKRSTQNKILLTWDFTVQFENRNNSFIHSRDLFENKLKSMSDVVKEAVGKGGFENIVQGVIPVNDTLTTGNAEFICSEEFESDYNTGSCRACPTGTTYDKEQHGCIRCPLGTYQDTDGSVGCITCPPDTTTLETGSRYKDNCTVICDAGYFSSTGVQPCLPCPRGTYQPDKAATTCIKCLIGLSTIEGGNTDSSNCIAFDLKMSGDQWIQSEQVSPDSIVDEYTIVSVIKIDQVDVNSNYFSILIEHPDDEPYQIEIGSLVLQYNLTETWITVIIYVNSSISTMSVYSSGTLLLFPHEHIDVSLKSNSTVKLISYHGSVVLVRVLLITPNAITAEETPDVANTCDVLTKMKELHLDPILSFYSIDSLNTSAEVEVITPTTCDIYNECLSSPCGHHSCINQPSGFQCDCLGGFTGTTCQQPPNYCLNSVCDNGATCHNSPENKTYYCECLDGFKGAACDYEIVNGGWTSWSDWSQCSVTCDGGIKTRNRTCSNPSPDDDGQPCGGEGTQLEYCSTVECPVCRESDLSKGYGVASLECTGDKSNLICTPTCRPGLVFPDEIPVNECENGEWSPEKKIEPCTKPSSPSSYNADFTLKYNVADCSNEKAILNQIASGTSNLACSENPSCSLNIIPKGCTGGNRKRSLSTVNVELALRIPINQTELEFGNENDEITRALNTLDHMSEIITNKSFFDVSINGVQYKSNIDFEAKMGCPPGSVEANGICAECQPGTIYNADGQNCTFCNIGTYQPKVGQTSCLPCLRGFTTLYIGSDRQEDCSVKLVTENEFMDDKKDHILLYTMVSIAMVAVVGVAIGTIVAYHKIRTKRKVGSQFLKADMTPR